MFYPPANVNGRKKGAAALSFMPMSCSQNGSRLALFLSSLSFFLFLYSYVCTFNNGGGKNIGVAWLANRANSMLIPESGSDSCSGRYIYVHNLPPQFNQDILRNCHSLIKYFDMCPYISNLGFGPKILNSQGVFQDDGWFLTSQFMLEVIFHRRMKQYQCLTNDSSAASAIFVPFYAGLDVGRYLWDFNTSVRDSAPIRLLRWLTQKPEWKRMWGRDHFLITGRICWDFRRKTSSESDWGNKFMFMPEAKNMTILGIESSTAAGGDIGIPYPTYFHPSSDGEVFQWQERMRMQRREYLYSFAGASRPEMSDSIRGDIIDQCRASGEKCKFLDCDPSSKKCDDPANVMRMFQKSRFCLQPPGDSYTRRSTFDCILGGCIPVFFDRGSAYAQYLWHLPRNYTSYSVFIPARSVREREVKIEDVLGGISEEEVLGMREEVIRLIPGVVYADPMCPLKTFKDAFDIAVKGVLQRVDRIRREEEQQTGIRF